MKWIKTEDALPDIDLDVLAYSYDYNGIKPFIAKIKNDTWIDTEFENNATVSGRVYEGVSHWMPIPEPPK